MDPWVPLAAAARAHGVRGEVRLQLFNEDSVLLEQLDAITLRFPDGSERVMKVESARTTNGAILAKLEGVNDRDQADALRGALVCVRRSQFPELEEGEFYAVDVIGLEVVITDEDSRMLGTVRDYVQYPTTSVFVVDCAAGGTLEVPVLEQFIEQVGRERVLVKNIGLLVE